MADEDHLDLLDQGVHSWNNWREQNPQIRPNLSRMEFSGFHLDGINLVDADLRDTDFTGASLYETDLRGALLRDTNLTRTDLTYANLSEAELNGARFEETVLYETDFTGAVLGRTIFADVDLSIAFGLEYCQHSGPSYIDFRTVQASGLLPINFLRGCGLEDNIIEYLPSLTNQAIQFFSCFISYSSKNEVFARRLHADLQDLGIRCWFAPHDLEIGRKTWDTIDEAIRLRDKLLVILSKAALDSDWVEDEVNKAFAEERVRKTIVLFPIRIDNAVMTTIEPWACKLRDQRHIGDFRKWKDPSSYNESVKRLLDSLKRP